MVGASFGVFYFKVMKENNSILKEWLLMRIQISMIKMKAFQIGEGLIGQCALEKQTILLNQVPNDYIKIRSGTGESSPKNIIILPVQFEGDVLSCY